MKMTMHDWLRVEEAIFLDFRHEWISQIKKQLNQSLMNCDRYALIESMPTSSEFHRRHKSSIAVRHVSGDRIVAMIEIVSPGNKNNRKAFRAFVEKAWELLEHRIHLLFIDPFPPGKNDPDGIHAEIWQTENDNEVPIRVTQDHPLALMSYECGATTEAFIETFAVGETVPAMPLFLTPGEHIMIPLEETYRLAWDCVPPRWQQVVAG
jgi:hypothetical protein